MKKDEWGIKRICLNCRIKFYDFNKSPIICPGCETVFDPEYIIKRKSKSILDKNDEEDGIEIDVLDDEAIVEDTMDLDPTDDLEADDSNKGL